MQDCQGVTQDQDLACTGSLTRLRRRQGQRCCFVRAPGAGLLTKLTHFQSYRRFPGNHGKATSEHFIEYNAPDGDQFSQHVGKKVFLKRMRGVGVIQSALKNGPNLPPLSAIYSAFTAMKQNQNGPTLGRGDTVLYVQVSVCECVCVGALRVQVFSLSRRQNGDTLHTCREFIVLNELWPVEVCKLQGINLEEIYRERGARPRSPRLISILYR